MSTGRVLGALAASLAVAGCAVVVVGMARADSRTSTTDAADTRVVAAPTARPAVLPGPTRQVPSSAAERATAPRHPATASTTSASTESVPTPTASSPASTVVTSAPAQPAGTAEAPTAVPTTAVARPATSHAVVRTAPRPATHPTTPVARPAAVSKPVAKPAARRGGALPLRLTTGNASKVVTVVAHSYGSTTATLQAWTKAPGGGWLRWGRAVTAHVGADGVSTHASESRSATPIGSFTLTRAFGHDPNPGTSLPFLHTTPADWWISQPGALYNTLQVCSSHCRFRQGSPNEHLYYETPYYDEAVVIDYNTRNAPGGVRQGAGSAFFLHVTDGHPTAGCVAIPYSRLTSIMRWLTPSAHPRILIGVG